MDSEDEMMITLLMQEEAEATVESKKGLLLLISLLCQWAKLQPPHIGGSVKGKRKNIVRIVWPEPRCSKTITSRTVWGQNISLPFLDEQTYISEDCKGVREYDSYFVCKKDYTGLYGFALHGSLEVFCIWSSSYYIRMAESTVL
jgi:hypothetical protein